MSSGQSPARPAGQALTALWVVTVSLAAVVAVGALCGPVGVSAMAPILVAVAKIVRAATTPDGPARSE